MTATTRNRKNTTAWLIAFVAVIAGGCARSATTVPPPAPVPVTPEVLLPTTDTWFGRPGVRTVPVDPPLERAVAAGTRTLDGHPGPNYWQQWVRYWIQAELDPEYGEVSGQQTVVYYNRSPDTLPYLIFHVYQNVFAPGAARGEPMPLTDGMLIERVVVDGVEAQPVPFAGAIGPGARYSDDGSTIMTVRLPEPLPPADSAVVEMTWSFTVPAAGAPRTGAVGDRLFAVAQWYPQVAVYDDLRGWHTDPYLGTGEFYLEYGEFNVSLTLPEGWLVAATGTLTNPEEVLSQDVLDRLRLVEQVDSVVHVVTVDDLTQGTVTAQAPGGQITWHFHADSVRDFAFSASSGYVWDATRAYIASGERPFVHAFYRPEATTWRQAAAFLRHATEFHSKRWAPYPYPQITTAEGPVEGMEYPMLMFVSNFGDPRTLYEVINHEAAHQWFPMLVGSNEAGFAWMDEGIATYIEHLATMEYFPSSTPFQIEMPFYRSVVAAGNETPLMRHADLHGDYMSYVVAAYIKPGLLLRALEAMFGADAVRDALAEYVRRWSYRHPTPHDFFRTMDQALGESLDWFWYPWWYETGVLDQAVANVSIEDRAEGERVTITIADLGDNPMPVLLEVSTADGATHQLRIPVEVWFDGSRETTLTADVAADVTRVAIDPEHGFPDIDPANNVWNRGTADR